jgi:hypothetical protein
MASIYYHLGFSSWRLPLEREERFLHKFAENKLSLLDNVH